MILRDYQTDIAKKAYNILLKNGIVYLSMQPRCGKTLTALHIAELYGAKKVLFVTKLKAICSIEADYKALYPAFYLTVINFESVTKVGNDFDICVCDEAHSIGTYPKPSKRWRDLHKIVKNMPVILMSATPSPESYSQLYHQFTINRFHSWNQAGSFYKWAKYYVNIKKKYYFGKEINDYSDARKELIERKTQEYFINFTQKQAGFTQEVEEKILRCEMLPTTMEMIRRLNIDQIINYNGVEILADTAVKLMSKVHQLSSGTVIDEQGNGYIVDDSKALFIKDYFQGQRIAIFYKFKQEFEMLKSIFKDFTISPESFQIDGGTYLGQFQSSREGIRLDNADALIFFNIDFSFLSYQQSKNRIISKERDRETPLYFVFSVGGIEEKIFKVVKKKEDYTTFHYKKDYGSRTTIKIN